jgi:lysine N6-hydroxylase
MESMKEHSTMHDIIGVGIGPFNLGLAAMLDKIPEQKALFFEQKPQFDWHSGLLIDGTTLQVPFMADVVTMADPTSPYTFLNYLKAHGRLYHFYFYEKFHIPRREYNHYCQWVAEKMDSCQFGQRVIGIDYEQHGEEGCYQVVVEDIQTNERACYYTKHVVLGVGSVPYVADCFHGFPREDVFHSAQFLANKDRCREADSITVIGSGQSAAEVFYELLKEQKKAGYRLDWFTRSRGFFPMEYSKLGLEHFSPDYTQYFYQLPMKKRDQLLSQQGLLYKGISAKTIADIYEELYEMTVANEEVNVRLLGLTEIKAVEAISVSNNDSNGRIETNQKYKLHCFHRDQEKDFTHESQLIILGTGYQHALPSCIEPLRPSMAWDENGRLQIHEDYRIKFNEKERRNHLFVQNGELHTHGIGAPDLGLGAYRNSVIINTLVGKECYPIQLRNVFQQFGILT